jgi:hypothetical protein
MQFSAENKGIKFYFDETDESQGNLVLRLPSKEVVDESRRKATNKVAVGLRGSQGRRSLADDVDEDKQNKLLWDYQIVSWDNVNLDGKKLECTIENKYTMMMKVPTFATFVNSALLWLAENFVTENEGEEGNFQEQLSGITLDSDQDLAAKPVNN